MKTIIQLTVFSIVVSGIIAYILINEVDFNQKGDVKEFVELYNNESETISLGNYVLLFYDGEPSIAEVYMCVKLTGYNITGNGYFLIDDRFFTHGSIQNGGGGGGADAVALHYMYMDYEEG